MSIRNDVGLPVIESYVSIQGEGKHLGLPVFILRLAGCNLKCPWCDSKFTWDTDNVTNMSMRDIIYEVINSGTTNLLITGGEPLLYDDRIKVLLRIFNDYIGHGKKIIETNGTIYADFVELGLDELVISPKLDFMSPEYLTTVNILYDRHRPNATLKFVVSCEKDISEVDRIVKTINADRRDVILMALGDNPDKLHGVDKEVIEWAIDRGYRWTPRAHIYVYGNVRGR